MPTPNDNLFTKAFRVEFDPRTANVNSLMAAIKEILGRSGCPECGRLGRFEMEFDPRVNPAREIEGVIGMSEFVKSPVAR